jgi:hypothetical protein
MAHTTMKLMTSRLLRPVMAKMLTDTDNYKLPSY